MGGRGPKPPKPKAKAGAKAGGGSAKARRRQAERAAAVEREVAFLQAQLDRDAAGPAADPRREPAKAKPAKKRRGEVRGPPAVAAGPARLTLRPPGRGGAGEKAVAEAAGRGGRAGAGRGVRGGGRRLGGAAAAAGAGHGRRGRRRAPVPAGAGSAGGGGGAGVAAGVPAGRGRPRRRRWRARGRRGRPGRAWGRVPPARARPVRPLAGAAADCRPGGGRGPDGDPRGAGAGRDVLPALLLRRHGVVHARRQRGGGGDPGAGRDVRGERGGDLRFRAGRVRGAPGMVRRRRRAMRGRAPEHPRRRPDAPRPRPGGAVGPHGAGESAARVPSSEDDGRREGEAHRRSGAPSIPGGDPPRQCTDPDLSCSSRRAWAAKAKRRPSRQTPAKAAGIRPSLRRSGCWSGGGRAAGTGRAGCTRSPYRTSPPSPPSPPSGPSSRPARARASGRSESAEFWPPQRSLRASTRSRRVSADTSPLVD